MDVTYFYLRGITEGHLDKVCDQTADRILGALLAQDLFVVRVACEVTAVRSYAYFGGNYR